MRFAVVAFAVLAVAAAQTQTPTPKPSPFSSFFNPTTRNPYQGQYYQGQYNQGQYNQGQYNQFQNRYPNQYQGGFRNRYQNYKPFVTSTLAPLRPIEPVAVTAAPAVAPSVAPVAVASASATAAPAPAPTPVIAAKVISDARAASIVKYGNEINADGTYNYYYETDNGIAAQAQGTPRNFGGDPPVVPDVAQGSFSWTSPEGEVITMTYVADENGYQPQGNAIPQAPEIPPQIARALAYLAARAQN